MTRVLDLLRLKRKPILSLVENPHLRPWHGFNSVNRFYTGHGFVLRAAYTEFSDRSGHYVSGFELSRHGLPITTFPVPDEYRYKENAAIDAVAAQLNKTLPRNP